MSPPKHRTQRGGRRGLGSLRLPWVSLGVAAALAWFAWARVGVVHATETPESAQPRAAIERAIHPVVLSRRLSRAIAGQPVEARESTYVDIHAPLSAEEAEGLTEHQAPPRAFELPESGPEAGWTASEYHDVGASKPPFEPRPPGTPGPGGTGQ